MVILAIFMLVTTVILIWDCKFIKDHYKDDYIDAAITNNFITFVVLMVLYVVMFIFLVF